MRARVFMFSGQGAQYFQMGRELYADEPTFRRWMQRCDDIARPLLGLSLVERIYRHPIADSEGFDRLLHTHPALLAVGYSLAQTLRAHGLTPHLLLGYSLGELIAATVSEVLSLSDALTLVIEQARLAELHAPPARMFAVLGPSSVLHEHPDALGACHLASVNHDQHFVVATAEADQGRIQTAFKALGLECLALPILRGFHSPLIEPLYEPLLAAARAVTFRPPHVPIVSCNLRRPAETFGPDHLWRVARGPVFFRETILQLAAEDDHVYLDVGPSGVLAGFVRRILGPRAQVHAALTPFGGNLHSVRRILEQVR